MRACAGLQKRGTRANQPTRKSNPEENTDAPLEVASNAHSLKCYASRWNRTAPCVTELIPRTQVPAPLNPDGQITVPVVDLG
jgi:hypothetical protein